MHRPPSPSRPRRRHSRRQHPGPGVCPVDGTTSFTDSWGAPRSGKEPQRNGHVSRPKAHRSSPSNQVSSRAPAGHHSEGRTQAVRQNRSRSHLIFRPPELLRVRSHRRVAYRGQNSASVTSVTPATPAHRICTSDGSRAAGRTKTPFPWLTGSAEIVFPGIRYTPFAQSTGTRMRHALARPPHRHRCPADRCASWCGE